MDAVVVGDAGAVKENEISRVALEHEEEAVLRVAVAVVVDNRPFFVVIAEVVHNNSEEQQHRLSRMTGAFPLHRVRAVHLETLENDYCTLHVYKIFDQMEV